MSHCEKTSCQCLHDQGRSGRQQETGMAEAIASDAVLPEQPELALGKMECFNGNDRNKELCTNLEGGTTSVNSESCGELVSFSAPLLHRSKKLQYPEDPCFCFKPHTDSQTVRILPDWPFPSSGDLEKVRSKLNVGWRKRVLGLAQYFCAQHFSMILCPSV